MTTLNANRYSSTSQLVGAAIRASVEHAEIVCIESRSDQVDAVCDELACASDDSADRAYEGTLEYWGTYDDGEMHDNWRVHVILPC